MHDGLIAWPRASSVFDVHLNVKGEASSVFDVHLNVKGAETEAQRLETEAHRLMHDGC